MKDLINYLVPRTLVVVAMLYALKMTVWPTMGIPLQVAGWFDPVWNMTASIRQSVTGSGTFRSSKPVVEAVRSPSDAPSTSAEPFTIEIAPAGSEPKRHTKTGPAVASHSKVQAPTEPTATSKPSRVAASKLP